MKKRTIKWELHESNQILEVYKEEIGYASFKQDSLKKVSKTMRKKKSGEKLSKKFHLMVGQNFGKELVRKTKKMENF